MNDHNFQTQTNAINLSTMSKDSITQLRNDCDRELDKRRKEEIKEFKAEMKKKAEKYGLVVKVETKKSPG